MGAVNETTSAANVRAFIAGPPSALLRVSVSPSIGYRRKEGRDNYLQTGNDSSRHRTLMANHRARTARRMRGQTLRNDLENDFSQSSPLTQCFCLVGVQASRFQGFDRNPSWKRE
jgi:hypothetical protein